LFGRCLAGRMYHLFGTYDAGGGEAVIRFKTGGKRAAQDLRPCEKVSWTTYVMLRNEPREKIVHKFPVRFGKKKNLVSTGGHRGRKRKENIRTADLKTDVW